MVPAICVVWEGCPSLRPSPRRGEGWSGVGPGPLCCLEGCPSLWPLSPEGRGMVGGWSRPVCCLVDRPLTLTLSPGGRGDWICAGPRLCANSAGELADSGSRARTRRPRLGVLQGPCCPQTQSSAFQQQLGVSGFQSEDALGAGRVGAPERTHVRDGGRPARQQRAVRSGGRDFQLLIGRLRSLAHQWHTPSAPEPDRRPFLARVPLWPARRWRRCCHRWTRR